MRWPLAVSALALAATALPWNCEAHRVVATIAERRMSARAVANVDRALAAAPARGADKLIDTGCWADEVRSNLDAKWHYINLFFRADGKAPKGKPDDENVVWAIRRFTREAREQRGAQRARAVRYLIHFVGDVHQPLHCVSRETADMPGGDRGGNAFPVGRPDGWRGRAPNNLHALWDAGCGEFTTPSPTRHSTRERALEIMREFPPTAFRALKPFEPMAWANEGSTIARESVYKLRPGEVPNAKYLQASRRIVRERIALAGYRLAAILEDIFGRS